MSTVKYLNSANHLPARITKANTDFAKKLDFKHINFPVKIRDILEIKKKNSIGIGVSGHENKEKTSILYIKKMLRRRIYWSILDMRRRQKHYVLIKDNTSCMIILYIEEKNIFAVNVYKLLLLRRNIKRSC